MTPCASGGFWTGLQAFEMMEQDLGRPIAAVFSSISEHPVAAASLGQVGPPLAVSPHLFLELSGVLG